MLTTEWDPVGTKVAPQSGQAQGPLIHSTPALVPTGPWAASTSMERIPRFGHQHSVGLDLAGAEELSHAFEPCLTMLAAQVRTSQAYFLFAPAFAAAWISSNTSLGWETIDAWLDRTEMIVAFMRLANICCS